MSHEAEFSPCATIVFDPHSFTSLHLVRAQHWNTIPLDLSGIPLKSWWKLPQSHDSLNLSQRSSILWMAPQTATSRMTIQPLQPLLKEPWGTFLERQYLELVLGKQDAQGLFPERTQTWKSFETVSHFISLIGLWCDGCSKMSEMPSGSFSSCWLSFVYLCLSPMKSISLLFFPKKA